MNEQHHRVPLAGFWWSWTITSSSSNAQQSFSLISSNVKPAPDHALHPHSSKGASKVPMHHGRKYLTHGSRLTSVLSTLVRDRPKEVPTLWLTEHLQCTGGHIRHAGGPHASTSKVIRINTARILWWDHDDQAIFILTGKWSISRGQNNHKNWEIERYWGKKTNSYYHHASLKVWVSQSCRVSDLEGH